MSFSHCKFNKYYLSDILQVCCLCCNMKKIIMDSVCNEINNDFYSSRPIYTWTKDNQLSINALLLKPDIAEREAASKKKRNSVITK